MTKENKPYRVNFAMAYGGRAEIVDATKKIAQMVFAKVEVAVFEEVDELGSTTRNEGGFGSTGLD